MNLDSLAFRDIDESKLVTDSNKRNKSRGASYKIQQVSEILRPTRQYFKWLELCQSNDVDANDLADAILERHQLASSIPDGDKIDWAHFDQLTEKIAASGIQLYDSSDFDQADLPKSELTEEGLLAANPTCGYRSSAIADSQEIYTRIPGTIFKDDNFLLLDMVHEKNSISAGLTAYWDGNQLMLPLGELCRNLDLPIEVQWENGTAQGWFLDHDRTFNMDLSKTQVAIEGKTIRLAPENSQVYDEEIYVDSDTLSVWFPVDFTLDFPNQTLEINTREKFPFEARLERENTWGDIGSKLTKDPVLPPLKTSYEILAAPVVELGLNADVKTDNTGTQSPSSVYYLSSRSDLAGMNAKLYISGTDEDGLDTFRGKLEKKDPDGELLGPLKANYISIGDIDVADFPVINNGDKERGIAIGNKDLYTKSEFDTTVFRGDALPGWDVEVYRNKMLIGSQQVGSNGQYEFEDIQLYYGNNEFEIVLYGPHGEEKHEKRNIQVGTSMLEKGTSNYQASLSQQDSLIYEPDDDSDTLDEGSLRFMGNYQYGLTENTSLNLGIGTQEIDGNKHRFLNAGTMNALKGIYLTGNYINDLDGGDAVQLIGQTGLGPLNINLKQEFFNDFVDEDQASVSSVRVYGNIDTNKKLPTIPFSMIYNTEDSGYKALNVGLAGKLKTFNYNTNLTWQDRDAVSDDDSTLEGRFNFITQFKDYKLRGKIGYDLLPQFEITQAQLINTYNINDDLSSEFTLEKNTTEDNYQGGLRLNWKNKHFTLSPEITYDTDNEFCAMLSFKTAFGANPASGKIRFDTQMDPDKGGLAARVYHDKNQNAVYDQGDEPVEGAVVKLPQIHKEEETDETGIAFIPALQEYRPTDVFVLPDSLSDPSLQPVSRGNSIVPRPGKILAMDIPVVTTGEIEGTIFSQTSAGADKPMGNVQVKLLDANGQLIQKTRSEYDGFYLFEKVPPGKYKVVIDDESQAASGSSTSDLDMVSIDDDGNVVSGVDVYLKKSLVPGPQETQYLSNSTVARNSTADRPTKITDKLNNVISTSTDKIFQAFQTSKNYKNLTSDPGNTSFGIHLSSYKSQGKAIAGVNVLARKYSKFLTHSDFVIRRVDLGGNKGVFYRVIAGAGSTADKAEILKQQIQQTGVYAGGMPAQNDSKSGAGGHSPTFKKTYAALAKTGHTKDRAIHLASYKTLKTATQGLIDMTYMHRESLNDQDLIIKKVDLGKKGTWYRLLAGRSGKSDSLERLQNTLRNEDPNQYARIMRVNG